MCKAESTRLAVALNDRALAAAQQPLRRGRQTRRGASLMEAMAVVTLSALLMGPVVSLLDSSHSLWEAVDGHASRRHAVDAAAYHLAREIHNAESVDEISSTADFLTLVVRRSDGTLLSWRFSIADQEVQFRVDTNAYQLLSLPITAAEFTGYASGGDVATTVPAQMRSIEFMLRTTLPDLSQYEVRRRAWLRKVPAAIQS